VFRQPVSKFFLYQLVHRIWGGYSNNFGWVPQIFWENQLVLMGTKWLFGWVPKISWSNQLVHWVLTGMGGWVNCKNAKIPVSTHDVGHQLDDPPLFAKVYQSNDFNHFYFPILPTNIQTLCTFIFLCHAMCKCVCKYAQTHGCICSSKYFCMCGCQHMYTHTCICCIDMNRQEFLCGYLYTH